MQRWEYTHIEGPERRLADLFAQMNQGGDAGWEAFATLALKKGITADTVAVLFKRPKPAS
jgi:hypothetical protein